MSRNRQDTLCFKLRPDEGPEDYVQRLHVNEMCLGATDAEIAEIGNENGVSLTSDFVRKVRVSFERVRRLAHVVNYAIRVREQTNYQGSLSQLMSLALDDYLKAHQSPSNASSVDPGRSQRLSDSEPVKARQSASNASSGGVPATSSQARGTTDGSVVAVKAAG